MERASETAVECAGYSTGELMGSARNVTSEGVEDDEEACMAADFQANHGDRHSDACQRDVGGK